SFRRTRCPTPRISSCASGAWVLMVASAPFRSGRGGGRRCGPRRRGGLDRLHDVHVAGAAADVAGDRPSDVVVRWIRIAFEQRGADEHHRRRAEPVLEAVLLLERGLDRIEPVRAGEAFDRGDLPSVGLHAEHRARLHRLAVHEDGAAAARRPASAKASSVGAEPTSEAAASEASTFFRPTPVSAMPALSTLPFSSVIATATATVAKSPTLRSSLRYVPPDLGGGVGTRTSVRISFGWIDVVNVSTRNSPIGTTRSPALLRRTTRAPVAGITDPRSPAGSACVSEPPIVPRLRT